MARLGIYPNNQEFLDAVYMPGAILFTVHSDLSEPNWIAADGRDFLDADYPALATALGGQFNTSGGRPAPAAGRSRVPGFMTGEVAGTLYEAKMPMGEDPAGAADINARGKAGGAFGHTHDAGTLTFPAHTHAPGGFYTPSHQHSNFLTANHTHFLFNSVFNMGDKSAAASSTADPFVNNGYVPFVSALDPGIYNFSDFSGNLGLTGGSGSAGPSVLAPTAGPALEPANPPYQTFFCFIKT